MPMTYHDLKAKTLHELRDIAKDLHHDAVQGYSQMNKDHLLPAVCTALGVDTHEHGTVVGLDKASLKATMRTLKAQRDAALATHDHVTLATVRRQLHILNHRIRSHVARTT